MEKLQEQQKQYLIGLVEQATETPNKEIKTQEFFLAFHNYTNNKNNNGYYITDKKSKYLIFFTEKQNAINYLIKTYTPTPTQKINYILEYLQTHNKNYTKKQYNYILELCDNFKKINK